MLSVIAFNQFTPVVYVWITPPGWQKVVRAMENSSYVASLEAKAKERYCGKLSCIGLSIQDDPYLPKNDARFVNDMPPGHGKSLAIHWRSTDLSKVKQYKIVYSWCQCKKDLIVTAHSWILALAMACCKLTWRKIVATYSRVFWVVALQAAQIRSSPGNSWKSIKLMSLSFPKAIIIAISATVHYHFCSTCQTFSLKEWICG